MTDQEKRIGAFLDEREKMRGLCPEQIAEANESPLLVADLRALLAALDEARTPPRHPGATQMTHTTLKVLLEHRACISGYNKLACHVAGQSFDEGRNTYVTIRHDEPITLATILESNGLVDALWALRACEQTPEMIRAERLFAVWCFRQVQHLMTDPRSTAALDVAERYADGLATDSELAAACSAAMSAASADAWDAARYAAGDAAGYATGDAAWDAAREAQKAKFIEVFCGESINVDCLRTKEAA